jgi:hypothetical protein
VEGHEFRGARFVAGNGAIKGSMQRTRRVGGARCDSDPICAIRRNASARNFGGVVADYYGAIDQVSCGPLQLLGT